MAVRISPFASSYITLIIVLIAIMIVDDSWSVGPPPFFQVITGAIAIIGICWFFKAFTQFIIALIKKKRRKESFYSVLRVASIGLMTGILSAGVLFYRLTEISARVPTVIRGSDFSASGFNPSDSVYHDPAVVGILNDINPRAGYSDLSVLFHDDSRLDINTRNTYIDSDARGIYDGHSISVRRDIPVDQQKRTIAHEYLHYIWYKNNLDSNSDLVRKLNNILGNSYNLRIRMQPYFERSAVSPTEIFSIVCTELPDEQIAEVLQDCNKYIDTKTISAQYNR